MIEWIRWIVVIGLIVGGYIEGKRQGAQDQLVQYQAQAIAERDQANADLRDQVAAGKENAAQAVVDLATVQASIKTIEQRTSGIGAQLRGALSASSLGTCVLPDDVQRLRADAYQQAGDAVTSANQARDPR